jgi:hypothetical protein
MGRSTAKGRKVDQLLRRFAGLQNCAGKDDRGRDSFDLLVVTRAVRIETSSPRRVVSEERAQVDASSHTTTHFVFRAQLPAIRLRQSVRVDGARGLARCVGGAKLTQNETTGKPRASGRGEEAGLRNDELPHLRNDSRGREVLERKENRRLILFVSRFL